MSKRIESYFQRIDELDGLKANAAHHFREESFVGINQKINSCIFFDSGREKDFKDFYDRKNEIYDVFFETFVSDPINDLVLRKFISRMKEETESFNESECENREGLNKKIIEISRKLLKEVYSFFGGRYTEELDKNVTQRLKNVRLEKGTNLVYLGEMRGCGLCRHRSVLFKLLCDEFGIACRILRGWFNFQGNQVAHAWNEIVLGLGKNEQIYTIDTMNFDQIVPHELVTKHYQNLGHPHKHFDLHRETISRLRENYFQRRRNTIGHGGFGVVYEIPLADYITGRGADGSLEMKKVSLAVKEVVGVSHEKHAENSKEDVAQLVKKEVEVMNLLRHENVVQVLGSFESEDKFKNSVYHIVMMKYDFNTLHFQRLLLKNLILKFSPLEQTTEVLVILLELARGLSHVHSFGIVHFDIKLENVLLNWDDKTRTITKVVISDFGSSKQEKMNTMITTMPSLTKKFSAPEILNLIEDDSSVSFTTQSDIYSFGVFMSYFRGFYDSYPNVQDIEARCLKYSPNDRPSIYDIIHQLRLALNLVKKKLSDQSMNTKEIQSIPSSDQNKHLFGGSSSESHIQKSGSQVEFSSIDKILFREFSRLCRSTIDILPLVVPQRVKQRTDFCNQPLYCFKFMVHLLTKTLEEEKGGVAKIVLVGEGSSGKTTQLVRIAHHMYEEWFDGSSKMIPIFICLRAVKGKFCVSDVTETDNFLVNFIFDQVKNVVKNCSRKEDVVSWLVDQDVLLILDSYDHLSHNREEKGITKLVELLSDSLLCKSLKIVIGTRKSVLQLGSIAGEYRNRKDMIEAERFQELFDYRLGAVKSLELLRLKKDNIMSYIPRFIKYHHLFSDNFTLFRKENGEVDEKKYLDILEEFPDILDLFSDPNTMLKVLKHLPGIHTKLKSASKKVEVMTRPMLFEEVVKMWYENEAERIVSEIGTVELTSLDLQRAMMVYSRNLARRLFESGEIGSSVSGSLLVDRNLLYGLETDVRQRLENLDLMSGIRGACLVELSDDQYMFVHKSIAEYFAMENCVNEIQSLKKWLIQKGTDTSESFSKKRVFEDKGVLNFLVEKLQGCFRSFTREIQREEEEEEEENEGEEDEESDGWTILDSNEIVNSSKSDNKRRGVSNLLEDLLAIIDLSKQFPEFSVAASNAFTVLTNAGVSLSGMCFRGISARDTLFYEAILDGTDFSLADLTGSRFVRSFICNAKFNGACLKDVYFDCGNTPQIPASAKHLFGKKSHISTISPCGGYLSTVLETGLVWINDFKSKVLLREFNFGPKRFLKGMMGKRDVYRYLNFGGRFYTIGDKLYLLCSSEATQHKTPNTDFKYHPGKSGELADIIGLGISLGVEGTKLAMKNFPERVKGSDQYVTMTSVIIDVKTGNTSRTYNCGNVIGNLFPNENVSFLLCTLKSCPNKTLEILVWLMVQPWVMSSGIFQVKKRGGRKSLTVVCITKKFVYKRYNQFDLSNFNGKEKNANTSVRLSHNGEKIAIPGRSAVMVFNSNADHIVSIAYPRGMLLSRGGLHFFDRNILVLKMFNRRLLKTFSSQKKSRGYEVEMHRILEGNKRHNEESSKPCSEKLGGVGQRLNNAVAFSPSLPLYLVDPGFVIDEIPSSQTSRNLQIVDLVEGDIIGITPYVQGNFQFHHDLLFHDNDFTTSVNFKFRTGNPIHERRNGTKTQTEVRLGVKNDRVRIGPNRNSLVYEMASAAGMTDSSPSNTFHTLFSLSKSLKRFTLKENIHSKNHVDSVVNSKKEFVVASVSENLSIRWVNYSLRWGTRILRTKFPRGLLDSILSKTVYVRNQNEKIIETLCLDHTGYLMCVLTRQGGVYFWEAREDFLEFKKESGGKAGQFLKSSSQAHKGICFGRTGELFLFNSAKERIEVWDIPPRKIELKTCVQLIGSSANKERIYSSPLSRVSLSLFNGVLKLRTDLSSLGSTQQIVNGNVRVKFLTKELLGMVEPMNIELSRSFGLSIANASMMKKYCRKGANDVGNVVNSRHYANEEKYYIESTKKNIMESNRGRGGQKVCVWKNNFNIVRQYEKCLAVENVFMKKCQKGLSILIGSSIPKQIPPKKLVFKDGEGVVCDFLELNIVESYGREEFTCISRIRLIGGSIGVGRVNYGLNKYGDWSSSSQLGIVNSASNLGNPKSNHSLQFNHFGGGKWVRWKSKVGEVKFGEILISSSRDGKHLKDFPKAVDVLLWRGGELCFSKAFSIAIPKNLKKKILTIKLNLVK